MRKLFLLIVVLLVIATLVFSLAELENILATLRQSSPLFLLAAVAVEILLLVNNAAIFTAIYRLVGLRENFWQLFLMVTTAIFMNIITPSAGMSGVAVLMNGARKQGSPLGRVTVAGVFYVLYDYVSVFAVLAAGFGVLVQHNRLGAVELTAAGILLLLSTTIAGGLAIGYRSTHKLGSLLAWLARSANRLLFPLLKKDPFEEESAYALSSEIAEGLEAMRANYKEMGLPLLLTLGNKLLLTLVLALAFHSMGIAVESEVLLAGFSIGLLFVYASITPSGIGVVDSILPVAFSSLGVPLAQAVLVALVYRAVTFWLPLGLGALTFRYLHQAGKI